MARWFLLLLTGCSLTLSGPDPNRPRNKPPTCDTSKGLVAADGVLAATAGLISVGVASNDGGAAVVPAVIGGLFLLSAVHGNTTVDQCNREIANYQSTLQAPPDEQVAQLRPPAAIQPASIAPPPPQLPPVTAPPHAAPPAQPQDRDPWAAFWREVP